MEPHIIISPDCPKRISAKFGMNIPIFNIMNCDKLCVNLFMGFDISGDKFPFSIGNGRRRYNTAPLSLSLL